MKVAQLIPHYFGVMGGLQVCVHNISEIHVRSGVDCYVFHSRDRPDAFRSSYKLETIMASKVDRFFQKIATMAYPLSKYFLSHQVARLQKRFDFDLWQINGGYPYGAFLADYFRNQKISCVLRCSGDDIQISKEFDYGVRRNPRIDKLIKENYQKYPALVAISKTVKDEYKKIGVSEKNIKLIPNGVDFERIAQFPHTDIVRKKHEIPFNAKIILTVGRNHPKKGYSLIPDILRRVQDRGIEVYWIIIGKECSRIDGIDSLGKSAGRIILIDEISFDGKRNDIPSDELIQYYKSADLFAMTSLLETFGIVLIEAMAAGLPVVCFDAPGVRDVMDPECGVMCDRGDVEGFSRAIQWVIDDGVHSALGKKCIEQARQYSWDIVASQYLNMYESLVLNRNMCQS